MLQRRRWWHPSPVLLPGKSRGRRSPVGCSPWGLSELDRTELLHFHFSLSCIGEGNGNPLQYSCLENPRDGGACWAAVYGVTQSRARLKRLSSSSSDVTNIDIPKLCKIHIDLICSDKIWSIIILVIILKSYDQVSLSIAIESDFKYAFYGFALMPLEKYC